MRWLRGLVLLVLVMSGTTQFASAEDPPLDDGQSRITSADKPKLDTVNPEGSAAPTCINGSACDQASNYQLRRNGVYAYAWRPEVSSGEVVGVGRVWVSASVSSGTSVHLWVCRATATGTACVFSGRWRAQPTGEWITIRGVDYGRCFGIDRNRAYFTVLEIVRNGSVLASGVDEVMGSTSSDLARLSRACDGLSAASSTTGRAPRPGIGGGGR